MKIALRWPIKEEWLGFGRHVVSWSAGLATGVATVVVYGVASHIITPDQASSLTSGFSSIAEGLKTVVEGVTTFVGGVATVASTAMGIWAALSSSRKKAAQIIAAVPHTTVVTDPSIASSTAEPNIVANTDHQVVPKA
jgi:hypothetical protein